jgi:ribosomal protein L21E
MLKRKNIKTKGKIKFNIYFQEFKDGERVAVIREHSLNPAFPKQIQGRSGLIEGKRGRCYIVKINDFGLDKTYILHPANLRKLK